SRPVERRALRGETAQVDAGIVLVDGRQPILGTGSMLGITEVAPDDTLAAGTEQPPVAGAFPTRMPQFHHPGLRFPVSSKGAISEPSEASRLTAAPCPAAPASNRGCP